ncbi:MAG: circadian clock protein KaiC [Candidatus Dormibacteria bacterium]
MDLKPAARSGAGPGDLRPLQKVPSGVKGLDDVLDGGLPKGRPTLLCGSAGCGKTLLAMQFLCRGAVESGEPGVFVAFEETVADLTTNMASIGYDLDKLQRDGLLRIEAIHLDPAEMVEAGEYDLEGLFLRIGAAVNEVGAKRIVVDTIEVLFGALTDPMLVRGELQRLFQYLKDAGLTAIVTAERGGGNGMSRHGIEEYVSDCVILLDQRIKDDVSTRILRVVKYRGSVHGTNEFPFLISHDGVTVVPITSLGLTSAASNERISTGIDRLDAMLSGGFYRGSSVLLTGSSGTGKTTFAASLADAACRRGERVLFVSREESPDEIMRNMGTVGLDLRAWTRAGLLRIESIRPTHFGLETHLAWLYGIVTTFEPAVVIIDPISSMLKVGGRAQVTSMIAREIDLLKSRGITAFFTTLISSGVVDEEQLEVSSFIDTWLLAETTESNGERDRVMCVMKSRGMPHSNQHCEFTIGAQGIDLLAPYVGPAGVLTGSARMIQQMTDAAAGEHRVEDVERAERALTHRRAALEAEVAVLHAQFATELEEMEERRATYQRHVEDTELRRAMLDRLRWATTPSATDDRNEDSA